MADALVFVTDASSELSAHEIEFLRTAHGACPTVVGVLTKIDFVPEWKRIHETDVARLREHGLPIELLPVSSTLRLRALQSDDRALNTESGYTKFVAFLRERVVGQAARLAARGAAHAVLTMTTQLEQGFAAERAMLADPDRAEAIARELEAARTRAEHLRSQAARWQVTLNDGFADLSAEADHDLRQRVRILLREADDAIDEHDPADVWDEFEPWLGRRVAADLSACYLAIAKQAEELAARVAEHFADEEGSTAVPIGIESPDRLIGSLDTDTSLEFKTPGAMARTMTGLRGGYSSTFMFSSLGSIAGLTLANPLILGIGLLMGRKAISDERQRAVAQRRQQAKQVVRKYADDAQFAVAKDERDTLRRLQRELRDAYQARADELQRTTSEAVARAQAAARTGEADRAARLRDVEAELQRLAQLRTRALALAPELAPGATR